MLKYFIHDSLDELKTHRIVWKSPKQNKQEKMTSQNFAPSKITCWLRPRTW